MQVYVKIAIFNGPKLRHLMHEVLVTIIIPSKVVWMLPERWTVKQQVVDGPETEKIVAKRRRRHCSLFLRQTKQRPVLTDPQQLT